MFPRGVCPKLGSYSVRHILKRCKLLMGHGHFHAGNTAFESAGNQQARQPEEEQDQQHKEQDKKQDSKLIQKTESDNVIVISHKQQIHIFKTPKKNEEKSDIPDLWKKPVDKRILPRKIVVSETETKSLQFASSVFKQVGETGKNKENFLKAIEVYEDRESVYYRGMSEFITVGLENMKEWGLHRDKDVYKALMKVIPTERFLPRSNVMAELQHFPKQQQSAIDVLEKMQNNGVIPDEKVADMIKDRFSRKSHVYKKFARMMYWMPKFRHANPFPIPNPLPLCPVQLAMIALQRMAIDLNNRLTVWKTVDVEESPLEDTFIVSAQSAEQVELLLNHPLDVALVVEGGHSVWLRDKQQTYFVLRSDKGRSHEPEGDNVNDDCDEDWTGLNPYFTEIESDRSILVRPSIHTQEDGTVLACCITGTASRDSVVTWIRYLQRTNPRLEHIPILFSIKTHTGQLEVVDDVIKDQQR